MGGGGLLNLHFRCFRTLSFFCWLYNLIIVETEHFHIQIVSSSPSHVYTSNGYFLTSRRKEGTTPYPTLLFQQLESKIKGIRLLLAPWHQWQQWKLYFQTKIPIECFFQQVSYCGQQNMFTVGIIDGKHCLDSKISSRLEILLIFKDT